MIHYFEKRAPDYAARSQRGLWRHFRELEWRAVSDLLQPRPGETAADLGCGAGFYALRLRRLGLTVLGIDESPAMLKQLSQHGISTRLANAEDYIFPRRFDKIVAAGLLEFVPGADQVLRHCRAGLRPGGKLVLLVPKPGLSGKLYKLAHEWKSCPVYLRSLEDYQRMARSAGLVPGPTVQCTPLSVAMQFR